MSSLPQILVFLGIAVIFITGLLLGRFTAPCTYLLVSFVCLFVCLFVCFIVGGVGGEVAWRFDSRIFSSFTLASLIKDEIW